MTTPRPKDLYDVYHAHVYFDAQTFDQAKELCQTAGDLFDIVVGRFHQRNVGPHPHWSCQLAFQKPQFRSLIEWLEENRDGLSILIHGVTGNDLEDHTIHASWLGEPTPLNLEMFGA